MNDLGLTHAGAEILITTIVRRNLMERPGYSPYCGGTETCGYGMPRSEWDGEQFKCKCGWRSSFPAEFIAVYKAKRAEFSKPKQA